MKEPEKNNNRIVHYLSGREDLSERKELYDWYDQLQVESISVEEQVNVAIRAKKRIMTDVRGERRGSVRRLWIKRWLVAASIIVMLGLGIYWYMPPKERLATPKELALRVPGRDHATITLPSGERVDLDSIPLENSVQIGNTVIIKNNKGEISYRHVGSAAEYLYVLQTPRSSTSEIVLSDGTKVLLNASSKLYYPASFGDGDRVVRIEGEGYFQVAKKANKSRFIVKSKGQDIRVLGTKFNIKETEEATYTSLKEGLVKVVLSSGKKQEVELRPGNQAVNQASVLSARSVDLESVLGWINGVFYFNGTNTEEVLGEIEQWYDIHIIYSGKGSVQYSGKIPRDLPLDRLIDLLTYADFKVESHINKDNKINLIIN